MKKLTLGAHTVEMNGGADLLILHLPLFSQFSLLSITPNWEDKFWVDPKKEK